MTTISIPFLDLENPATANTHPAIASTKRQVPIMRPVSSQTRFGETSSDQSEIRRVPAEFTLVLPTRNLQPHPQMAVSRSLEIPNDIVDHFDRTIRSGINNNKESAASIEKLVDSILERFPLGAPTTLMFVGTEDNRHTSMTCGLIAAALASRKIGNVLLIDSSSKNELTYGHSLNDQRGLSNLLAHCEDWLSAVHKLSISGLDFLPSGTTHWQNWGAESNLRKMSLEFKRRYQFICVSAGDALHSNSGLWASVCDGTYLLVSLKNANQDIAQSSVAELQSHGARLLGCIVTDTDLTT